jgi:predicted transcriptional regulator
LVHPNCEVLGVLVKDTGEKPNYSLLSLKVRKEEMSKNFEELRKRAVQNLIEAGIVKRRIVAEALLRVPREEFIPETSIAPYL